MNSKGIISCFTTRLTVQTCFSANTSEQQFNALYYFSLFENSKYINDYLKFLTPEELEQGSRYKFEVSRHRYYIGKIAAKLLIKKYANRPFEKIIILKGKNDKPYLKPFDNYSLVHFNLSHSDDAILIAISNKEVGVDIEQNRLFNYAVLMDTVFTKNEINFIKTHRNPNQAFFILWTRKEAFLKATGTGLTENLTGFEVLDGENILNIDNIKQDEQFDIVSFYPFKNYIAAFCQIRQIQSPKISFISTTLQEIL